MNAESTATNEANEFNYLDFSGHAEERSAQAACNKGFAVRKALLSLFATVNTEISLKRYSLFETLHDELLPNSKLEINLVIMCDDNLIWQAADDCHVIITKLQLIVPRLLFNSEEQKLFMNEFLNTRKWTYLRENIEASNSTTQRTGKCRISTGITRPRHVFVFIINDVIINTQTANPFFFAIHSEFPLTDPRNLISCYFEVGNGNEYPEQHYKPATEPTRVYRAVLNVFHGDNEYSDGTLLNTRNFRSSFPFCLLRSHKTRIGYQRWYN